MAVNIRQVITKFQRMHRHKTIFFLGSGVAIGLLVVPWALVCRYQQPHEIPSAETTTCPIQQNQPVATSHNSTIKHAKPSRHLSNARTSSAETASLLQLLNKGRQLSQQGDAQAIQVFFGKNLLRSLRQNITDTLPVLLSILKDSQENDMFRKTILEALTWSDEYLSENDKRSLFHLAMHIMRHESDPDLRAAALHAAATMMHTLKTQQLLSEEEQKQFLRITLQYVEDRDQPEPLRRSAIIELTSTHPSGLSTLLLDILKAHKSEPVNLVRCATVALADLRKTDTLPEMIDLLDQTYNPSLFLSLSYAITKLDSDVGLAALVRNADRFEGASQPYIARHIERIEKNLTTGEDMAFATAIAAIQFLPERMSRLQLMEQAISTADSMPRDKISPPAARALLTLVASLGTPADCDKTLALLGEDTRWQNEWNQVQNRRRIQPGIISSYKKIE